MIHRLLREVGYLGGRQRSAIDANVVNRSVEVAAETRVAVYTEEQRARVIVRDERSHLIEHPST